MTVLPPIGELVGQEVDLDLAADYLELAAYFAADGIEVPVRDLVDAHDDAGLSLPSDIDAVNEDLDSAYENLMEGVWRRLEGRRDAVGKAYPFALHGEAAVSFRGQADGLGATTYLLCLVLSHLRSVSDLLTSYPTDAEVQELRNGFQCAATAAIAGELGGRSWSFGWPRPDRSGFLPKLREIWDVIGDGQVAQDPKAAADTKDDGVDVIAWAGKPDGLPGCMMVAGQVATGRNWREKSARNLVENVFWGRWFARHPVSQVLCYHVIPFALRDEEFADHVRVLGHVLHRLRVPRCVQRACDLRKAGLEVEAFDQLAHIAMWLETYRQRVQ